MKDAGATEALKARDPMRWVGLMNACKAVSYTHLGVQFALVDADGNQIMTAETEENGLASFERIPHGRYSVCLLYTSRCV